MISCETYDLTSRQKMNYINLLVDALGPGDSVEINHHTITHDEGHIYNLDAKEIDLIQLKHFLIEEIEENDLQNEYDLEDYYDDLEM